MDITVIIALLVVFLAYPFKGGTRGAKAQTWLKKKLSAGGMWILKAPYNLSKRIFSTVTNKTVRNLCSWVFTGLLYAIYLLVLKGLWNHLVNGVIALLA